VFWTIVSCVVGFLTGILAGFIVSLVLFLDQFSFSLAGSRVKETVKATKEITKLQDRAGARNRYRYSLGVIIDTLDQTWNSSEFREDEWPPLVHFSPEKLCVANEKGEPDSEADRWALFNEYVKPVIENVNSFSFLGRQYLDFARIFRKGPEIRQLTALTDFCNQLRAVVSEFDAAYGNNLVKMVKVNNKVVIQPVSDASPQDIKPLREAYRELHRAWGEWLRAVSFV
jgi:hypothetical protein